MAFHSSTPTRYSRSASPLSLHSTTVAEDSSHRGFSPRLRRDRSQHYTSEGEDNVRTEFNNTVASNRGDSSSHINDKNNNMYYNKDREQHFDYSNDDRPTTNHHQSPFQRSVQDTHNSRIHFSMDRERLPQLNYGILAPSHHHLSSAVASPRDTYLPKQQWAKEQQQQDQVDQQDQRGQPQHQKRIQGEGQGGRSPTSTSHARQHDQTPRLIHSTPSPPHNYHYHNNSNSENNNNRSNNEDEDGDVQMDLEELHARTRPLHRQQATASAPWPRSNLRNEITSSESPPLTATALYSSSSSSFAAQTIDNMHNDEGADPIRAVDLVATTTAKSTKSDATAGDTVTASVSSHLFLPPASSLSFSSSSITSFPLPDPSPPSLFPVQAQNQAPSQEQKESKPMSLSNSSPPSSFSPSSSSPLKNNNKGNTNSAYREVASQGEKGDQGNVNSNNNNNNNKNKNVNPQRRGDMDVDKQEQEKNQKEESDHGQIHAGTDTGSIPVSSSKSPSSLSFSVSSFGNANDTGQVCRPTTSSQEATNSNTTTTMNGIGGKGREVDELNGQEGNESEGAASAKEESDLPSLNAGVDLSSRAPVPPSPAAHQHHRQGDDSINAKENTNGEEEKGHGNANTNINSAHADGSALPRPLLHQQHHNPFSHSRNDPLEQHNGHPSFQQHHQHHQQQQPHNPPHYRTHPYPSPPHRQYHPHPPRHTATFPPYTPSSSSVHSSHSSNPTTTTATYFSGPPDDSSITTSSQRLFYLDSKETTSRRMLGRSSEPAVSVSSPSLVSASSAAHMDPTATSSPSYYQQQQQHRPASSPSVLSSGRPSYLPPPTSHPQYDQPDYHQYSQYQQHSQHSQQQQQQPFHPNYNHPGTSPGGVIEGGGGVSASVSAAGEGERERGGGGPTLSNKRRSLADLLFVPIKSKEKRNSSASSTGSADSFRPDDVTQPQQQQQQQQGHGPQGGEQQQPGPYADWANHPSSAAAALASLSSPFSSSSSSLPSSSSKATPLSLTSVPTVLAGTTTISTTSRMSIVDSPTSPSARKSLGNNTGTRPSPATVHALNRGLRGASLSSGHLPGSAAGQSPGGNGGSGSTVSSPKTFQCTGYPGCNMVFTRSEHLARHERKHTGEKPYKCIVANCPRTFSRYDNMIQHTQTHGDRSKRDSLASGPAAAAVSSASQSRSSSVQSTPLITRPRGGSSPMIFHEDSNRSGYSSSQQSPAVGSYGASPAMNYHHHQQQHNLPHGSHHPIQWSHPSGAPATASPGPPGSGYAHGYPLPPGSSPMTRTLKANSRSLPHLQPRSSTGGSLGPGGDSPSGGLQQGMSSMEIEELKRRKSEILLPSYSRAAGSSSSGLSAVGSAGYAPGAVARFGRGGSGGSFSSSTQGPAGGGSAIGLGMSPFTQTTSHPQSLPKVEQLTPQEQERLNEHRRSAQAALFKNNPTGSMDPRAVSSIRDLNASPYRNVSVPGLPQHHLLDQDKERFLDHRKSILGPINNHMDPRFQKRSSNDPTDMVVQPLPSRDARSGMQWFSQVNAAGTPAQPPATASPRSSMTLRDQPPTGLSSFAPGEQPFGHPTRAMISSSSASSRHSSMDEGPMVLPPILGNYEQQEQQQHTSLATHTQPRPRTQSSHVHPLSRPSSSQFDPPTPTTKGTEIIATAPTGERRFKYEPILAPGLERQLEDRFYPIRKREVVEEIERMDAEQYVHLWSRVSNAFATEQFRNPEALCNLTAILCVVRINTEAYGSVKQEDDANHGSRDMEIDDEGSKATESSSMDVDSNVAAGASVAKPCRAILNIDADNYRRDPEQELKDIEELTLTSRVPVHSFVAAFEIPPTTPASSSPNAHWQAPTSESGCPETAGLARLYLPENSFRPKESLQLSPALIDPAGPWQVCEFQEFPGLAVWVQQETLSRYRTLATKGSKARPPYRMALTLLERGPSRRESGSSVGSGNRDDSYISENGNDDGDADDDVRLKESVLYPNMIERVWKDMFHQYQEHQHQLRLQQQQQQQQHHHSQHYQQQQYQPYPPPPLPHNQHHPQQHPQQQQSALPPPLQKRVATYEEYHNSLQQQHVTAEASRRESGYHPQQQQQQQALYFHPPPPSQQQQQQTSPTGAYHDYRGHRQSGFMHREDLSSAPSSPRSPSIRDDLQEESLSSTSSIGSAVTAAQAQATANMHRRISIAELCNPMQGLATERDRLREGGSSGNEPPSNLPKRSSM